MSPPNAGCKGASLYIAQWELARRTFTRTSSIFGAAISVVWRSEFFLGFLSQNVLFIDPNDFVETLESNQRVFVTGGCPITEE